MAGANYVGRVGALAVALGIGTALVTSPGVALAGPEPSQPSNSDSPDPTPDAATDPTPTAPTATSSPTPNDAPPATVASGDPRDGTVQASGGAQVRDGASGAQESPKAKPTDEPSPPESPNGTTPSTDPTAATSPPVEPEPAAPVVDEPSHSGGGSAAVASAPNVVISGLATARSLASPGAPRAVHALAEAPAPSATTFTQSARTFSQAAAQDPTVQANLEVSQAATVPPNPIAGAVSFVTGVVSAVLAWVGLSQAPTTPVEPPLLWALVEWVRRQTQHTLLNHRPTLGYDPTETSQSNGVVTGDLNGDDAEGDPLTYTVTQDPTHGTVVVRPDGTFTYTPHGAPVPQDTFKVTVSDTGFHLHGLLGFLQSDGGHSSGEYEITVPVNRPPVADPNAITRVQGDVATGVVTGSLGVTDPDHDGLTYTVLSGPAGGKVTIDPATGTYTYTPTTAARLAAGVEPPPTTQSVTTAAVAPRTVDSFIVAVSDGENVPVVVTVAGVPISPLEFHVGQPFAYQESPSSPYAVRTGPDGRAYLIDAVSGTIYAISPNGTVTSLAQEVQGAAGSPDGIAVSPDGSRLYVANPIGRTVDVFDSSTGEVLKHIPVGTNQFGPSSITMADNGTAFAPHYIVHSSTGQIDVLIAVIDTSTDTVVDDIPVSTGVVTAQASSDGRYVYTYGLPAGSPPDQSASIVVVDTTTGQETAIPFADNVPDFYSVGLPTLRPDDKRLYVPVVTRTDDGSLAGSFLSVVDVDPSSATYLDIVDTIDSDLGDGYNVSLSSLSFSPDSSVAYIGVAKIGDSGESAEFGIALIDTSDHSVIKIEPVGVAPLTLAMSSDGVHGYIVDPGFQPPGGISGDATVSIITISPASSAISV